MPYRSIEDPAKLRRVLEATLIIEANLEIDVVLRHLIEEARSITGAQYGALGVLNEDRNALSQFVTVGLGSEQEKLIGSRPTGKGVLGLLITDPHPVRIADLSTHPLSSGFPPHHPPMTSFLGVPVKVREEVYGNLYLTNKVGWSEFTNDDEALVGALGLAAGIAIENSRLHARTSKMAVYEDRDRMAKDLHDNVIQRLFAVGLSLQSVAGAVEPPVLARRIEAAVSELDDTIRQVRSTIFALATTDVEQGLRANLMSVAKEVGELGQLDVNVAFEGPLDSAVSPELSEHALAVVREATTNVSRHAAAAHMWIVISLVDEMFRLEVNDDGIGIDASAAPSEGGLGLGNLSRRAEKLHGSCRIGPRDGGGTSLVWEVPVF